MPLYTQNYNLTKPLPTENYDVMVTNANMDRIDTELKSNDTKIRNLTQTLTTSLQGFAEKLDMDLEEFQGVIEQVLNENMTTIQGLLENKVDNSRVLTDVPEGAVFTDTTYEPATEQVEGLLSKEDKKKLNGIEDGANNYEHPSEHPASMIKEDDNRRFVTKAEKEKLVSLPSAAINAISSGSTADPDTTQESYILTNHANSPGGGIYWHIITLFYTSKTGNRSQIAISYNGSKARIMIRHYYSSWYAWQELMPLSGGTFSGTVTLGSSAQLEKMVGTAKHTLIDNSGKIWRSVYNDIAEFMIRDNIKEDLEPGDVLIIGENGLTKTSKEQDSLVVGVYSDTYGVCLGGEEGIEPSENYRKYIPIGISGRVLVKVDCSVKKGDLLVSSSNPGYATVMKDFIPGTVIGKVMEDSDGSERVWTLIMNC